MKRLVAVVMMIATGVFMVTTMASAEGWGAIHGNYEMVAMGTCLHDKDGFVFSGDENDPTLKVPFAATPKSSNHFISAFMGEGTWTFHSDGTGAMQVMQYCILPDYPGSTAKVTKAFTPSPPQPWTETIPFTYEVQGSSIRVILPTGLTLDGRISSDHKTMSLQSAMPVAPQGVQYNGLIGYYQICTIARTLFRVDDHIMVPRDNRLIR